MTIAQKIIVFVSLILFALGTVMLVVVLQSAKTASATSFDQPCRTRAISLAPVGTASTVLLATTSVSTDGASRAYARLQLLQDASGMATGTIWLSFDEGAKAVAGQGIPLSTSSPSQTFGLGTTHPYDGAVTGISNPGGATVVLVTECVYAAL